MNIQGFMTGLTLAKTAVDLASSVTDLIADPVKREAARVALDQSKRAFAIAETKMAEELEYPLCQCDFPPGICTLDRSDRYICPKCKRAYQVHAGKPPRAW
jgi:transposase-like protein